MSKGIQFIRRIVVYETVLTFLAIGLLGYARAADPTFLKLDSQLALSSLVWEMALLAIPMTIIIISGGIDLSIGSNMALSAVVMGLSFQAGLPIGICAAAALLTGLSAGLLNGVFVAWAGVHPLIVTLATMSAFRGIAEGISWGRPVSGYPEAFLAFGQERILGLPLGGWIFLVAATFASALLGRSTWGTHIYAIGHNEIACRFSGISVGRVKVVAYLMSGLAAGVAAVLFVARRNTAKADIAMGMELDVITAVVLGGTSIYGGQGRILGTILGVFLIHETRQFVSWHWNQGELIQVVIGSLLIVSVLLHSLFTRSFARDD